MALPVTVVILEPADRKWKWSQSIVQGVVKSCMGKMQRYLRDEVGATFDYETIWHKSVHDSAFLALETANNKDWRDQNGEGADSGKLMWDVCRGELGLQSLVPGIWCRRTLIFYSNGGGWAGGSHAINEREDQGFAIVGDHFMRIVDGKRRLAYVSHEFLGHALGLTSHDGKLLPDLTLLANYFEPLAGSRMVVGQKVQLFTNNMRFLRDA